MLMMLVKQGNNELKIDSREVAEMTGKRHDNLVRDIKDILRFLRTPQF